MFYEFIVKIFDNKPGNFVLRREDVKLLIDIFKEEYNKNKNIK